MLVTIIYEKFMEDSTRPAWIPMKWRNKVAAGFTNSGAMHGDKLNIREHVPHQRAGCDSRSAGLESA